MVRALVLAAVRAFLVRIGAQSMVRPAHIAARLGHFLLRNGHGTRLSLVGPGSPVTR